MEGKSSKCPICFEPLNDKRKASPDICDHDFCLTCLLRWSRRGTFCPVDRKRFKKIVSSDKIFPIKPLKRKKQIALYDVSVYCEKCTNDNESETLILCDSCDLAYHCDCLVPPLLSIPPGQWFCPDCETITQKMRPKSSAKRVKVPLEKAKSKKVVNEPKLSISAVSYQSKSSDDFAVKKEIKRNSGKGIWKHTNGVEDIVGKNKKPEKVVSDYRPCTSVKSFDWASNILVVQKEKKKNGSKCQTISKDNLAVEAENKIGESSQFPKHVFNKEMNSFLSVGKTRVSGGGTKPASENLEDFFNIHEDNSITKSKPWMQTQKVKECTTSSENSSQEPFKYDSNTVCQRLKVSKRRVELKRTDRLAAITCKQLLKDLNKNKSSNDSLIDEDSSDWSVFDEASVLPKKNHIQLSCYKIPIETNKSRHSNTSSQNLKLISDEKGMHKMELNKQKSADLSDESCKTSFQNIQNNSPLKFQHKGNKNSVQEHTSKTVSKEAALGDSSESSWDYNPLTMIDYSSDESLPVFEPSSQKKNASNLDELENTSRTSEVQEGPLRLPEATFNSEDSLTCTDSNAAGRQVRKCRQKGQRTARLAAIAAKKVLKEMNKNSSPEDSSTDEDFCNQSTLDQVVLEELPLQNCSQYNSTHNSVIPILDIRVSPEPEPTDETYPADLESRTEIENASKNENDVSTQFSVFEKLDNTFVSSQKYSNINMAISEKYRSSKKTFNFTPHKNLSSLENSKNSGSSTEKCVLSKTQTSFDNTISNNRNNDFHKNAFDNFDVRQVHYAIKAKMNLPTELKRIEQEKWQSKPSKSLNKYKLKSSCSNSVKISSVESIPSASKQHIVSHTVREVYGADVLENGNGSIENRYEYRSIKESLVKHSNNVDNCFHSVNAFIPKKLFSLEEYDITQFKEQPVYNNIPRNILENKIYPNNLKHLDIREDGSLFLNWNKSSS